MFVKDKMDYAQERLLIRHCSRIYSNQKISGAIDSVLNPSLNWTFIINYAQDQAVAPLLDYYLSSYQERVPAKSFSELKNSFEQTKDFNSQVLGEFKSILNCFKRNNIESIPLKGIDLAVRLYPDIGLRPLSDIDILIRKQDLPRIEDALVTLNYLMHPGYKKALDQPPSPYLNTVVCRKLTPPTLSLHLHWHIFNSSLYPYYGYISNFDIEHIWQKAQATKIDGIEVLVMQPNQLLLYLCDHHLRHAFDRLILLTDIDAVLNYYHGRLDWSGILRDAFKFNFNRQLFYGLYLVSQILGTKVPKDILFKLKPRHMNRLESKFLDSVLQGRPSKNLGFLTLLAINKGILKKIIFLFRVIIPHPKFLFQLQDIRGIKSPFKYTLNRFKRIFRYIFNSFLK